MDIQSKSVSILQQNLKEKPFYKEVVKKVEKASRKRKVKKEPMKIHPYAEHPWMAFPELFSSRWNN